MNAILQDLRYGARAFFKRPGFTLIAVLTLALGIGASTAIFSIVNAVLLRELPYRDEERIVTLWQSNLKSGVQREDASPANFFDWRERVTTLETLAAAEPFGHSMIGHGEPEAFRSWLVTRGFFEALGASPLFGRIFLPEEYEGAGAQVVILGHGLWQRRFGGDPNLVGQKLILNGQPHTVVAIMPPDFAYPPEREVWAPRMPRSYDRQSRAATYIKVIGRLREGRTPIDAQNEMNAIAAQLSSEHPQTNTGVGVVVEPISETLVGEVRPALLLLFGAVGFVLLIACANVGSLLLARAAERRREFAIRAALGASRRRLLLQSLTESMLLALAGGAGGVLLAGWIVDAILAFGSQRLPRVNPSVTGSELDTVVLLFALGVSLLTAFIFGLAPALELSRIDLQEGLRSESRTATSGGKRERLRRVLVVAEIALAVILSVGAGLLARSFIELVRVDPGFIAERGLALETQIGRNRTPAERAAFVSSGIERVAALPGVEAVGLASALPFHDNQVMIPTSIRIEGRATLPGQDPTAYLIQMTPDYLRALGVPLVSGRALDRFDKADSAPVALINRAMAERNWGAESPLGQKISFSFQGQEVTSEIVGVVSDVRPHGLESEPRPEVYVPYAQFPVGGITWLVRTSGDPMALLPAVKEKIREGNPNQTFASIATMEQLVDRAISPRRFNLLLLGSFAVLALGLASIGLYGLISFLTAQRTHEIGIRLALGAEARDILRMVVGEGLRLALCGVGAGLAGALALVRMLQSLLYGVSAFDPLTFAVTGLLLVAVAMAASYLPARRAMRVDPMVALKYE